jgi:hypothetical protein
MSEYKVLVTYLSALLGRFRDDERGSTISQEIVVIGAALIGAFVIAGILWAKLKSGASDVNVPAPAAP